VLLLISVLFSTLAPLRVQAQTNNPPYVIRGHIYEYGTAVGLAGARIRVDFEDCNGGAPEARFVLLPLTDSSGAWEFDERNYQHLPCPGTTFTLTQQVVPAGYVAVAVQTSADPVPAIGDTILLTPPGSGTYEGNDFFDRLPYVIRGHVYQHHTTDGLGGARVEVQYEACDASGRAQYAVTLPSTDSSGAWEFDERNYQHLPCPGTTFTLTQQVVPAGYVAVAVQTPADPIPVIGDTILLTPPGSGTYEGNVFFDRLPYVIRGHVYQHHTTDGLWGARVQVQYEACDASGRAQHAVTLPPTDSSGAWEFDERNYQHLPCPATPFTLTQQVVPVGYIAVRVKTPADPDWSGGQENG
jgi:hypothetical protein